MPKSISNYSAEISKKLKTIAHDNAVRNRSNDTGFDVVITKEEIKKDTNRSRLKPEVLNKLVSNFNSNGFNAKVEGNNILVTVPPLLGQKDFFTLDELSERENAIKEINLREAKEYYD